jgi:hypothetical protein
MNLLGNAPAGISPEDWHDSENPLVPGRVCGTCTLCCKLYALPELNKPAGTWCVHAVARKGCNIHPQRPQFCHQFFCGWRLDPNLGPEWKPEISRLLLWISEHHWSLMLTVDPDMPHAWKRQPYYAALKEWAQRAFKDNKKIVILVAGEATVVLPDRDVPLGPLTDGDEIVLFKEGPGYGAELRRRAPADAAGDAAGV